MLSSRYKLRHCISVLADNEEQTRADCSDWSDTDEQPELPVFEMGTSSVPIDPNCDPFHCFSVFFYLNMIKLIKTETNRYAAETIASLKRQNKIKKNSMWHRWSTVKLKEIYCFFSIVLHMCLVKLPKIKDYWSTTPFLQTQFASKLLSRNRFSSILYMLHVNNNSTFVKRGEPGHDPLHKVRPFFQFFIDQCDKYANPYMNLTVDEGMCPFRGRVGFRVYMKNKPNRYGLKLFMLCDASTGFILKCEVYTGKAEGKSYNILSIFERLCSKYFGKGHCIFMDRFYTSPQLLRYMWENKTYGVGTVMKNRRGLPTIFKTKKLKKGEMIFKRNGPILACKWKSTRDVYCLSTKHKATTSEIPCKTKDGIVQIIKPDIIADYNQCKTGVDRSDQLQSYYPFGRRTMKWWKKLFFHLFMMGVVNGFTLYKLVTSKNIKLSDFILQIGQKLAELGGEAAQNEPQPSTSVDRVFARHFPKKNSD